MRLILLLVLAIASCSKSETPAPRPTTTESAAARPAKDPAAAKQLIESGATVVDVRTLEEFEDGALPNAKHIPVSELGARMDEVGTDKSKPVVVYCASGGRAGKAKAQLEAAGYTQVVNGGGLDDLR